MKLEFSRFIKDSKKDVFDAIDEKVAELRKKGIKVIDMGVGDTQKKFDPSPKVIEELSISARKKKNAGYPGNKGQDSYLEACSRYMKRSFSVDLDPKTEINLIRGSKEGVYHFPMTLLNVGDLAIIPTPGYPPFHAGVDGVGGESFFVPLLEKNDFLIDFESIPKEVAKRAKMMWINYPNSPTGVVAPKDYLTSLVKWAKEHSIVIASDEGAYIDIYYDERPTSILEITKEGVVAFYSLSKRNNMTGYRIGFICGDKRLVEAFYKVKCLMDDGIAHFIQDAATVALDDDTQIKAMRKEYKQRREIIMGAFSHLGFEPMKSRAGFFLWQKVPKGMDGDELAERLMELGIVVLPGSVLSREVDGFNPGKDYIRLGLMISMEEANEAAARLKKLKF